jgi:hypothetical protein
LTYKEGSPRQLSDFKDLVSRMNRGSPKIPKRNNESMSGTGTESRSSKEENESLVRPEQPSGLSHRRFVDTNSLSSSPAIPFPTGTTNTQSSANPDNTVHNGNILESLPPFLQPVLEWTQVEQPVEWHVAIPPESHSVVRRTPVWRQRQKERLRPAPSSPPPGCVKRLPRCSECKKQKKVCRSLHIVLIEGTMFPIQKRSIRCLRSVQATGIS